MLVGIIGLVTLALVGNIVYYELRFLGRMANPKIISLIGWRVDK